MAIIYFHLFFFIFLRTTVPAATSVAKPGCSDTCGNVTIPYPFGVGESCSLNKWYSLDCKSSSSTPYLSAFNDLEVLDIDFDLQRLTVNAPVSYFCQDPLRSSSQISKLDLGESPFLVDRDRNTFVFHGCGTVSVFSHGVMLAGCSTNCRSSNDSANRSYTDGFNYCETRIDNYIREYSVGAEWNGVGGGCGYVFLVDAYFFDQGRNSSFVPVRLVWTFHARFDVPGCKNDSLALGNGKFVENWQCDSCRYLVEDGNPYLYGCHDTKECTLCKKLGGRCDNDYVNDAYYVFKCHEGNWWISLRKATQVIIIGVGVSICILILVACSFALYNVIKRTKETRRRKRFFKRNGGKLLEQQQAADEGLVDKTIHFTEIFLEKATDNFNENRILGRGGQGTVYKGMLTDGRIVAVKRSKLVDESQLKEFINEVVILSQISHRNVVKLLGCCLETEVPLLVSEFISNGTLYDHLHDESKEYPISFKMRLQMATEVAGALSYLHSSTSIPIYHRDIKTTNILLDEKYEAKISDFGISRFVSIDKSHLTTKVKGTFGYLDPEYWHTSQFTEKSDVYSFGVILAELLTGEKPISLTGFGEHRNLAMHFTSSMEEGQVMSILDAIVLEEGAQDEIMVVANLVMRCLNANGKNRPTMKEVASELQSVVKSQVSMSAIQTDYENMEYNIGEDEPFLSSSSETTLTRSFNRNTTSDQSPSKRNATERNLSLNLDGILHTAGKKERQNRYSKLWTH